MRKSSRNGLPGFGFIGLGTIVLGLAGLLLIGCGEETVAPPTDPDAEIVILSPKGGENFKVGTTQRIQWKLQGKGLTEVNAVNIELSPDSGKTWLGLLLTRSVALADPDWADYQWAIPAQLIRLGVSHDLVGNSKLLLRVMQYSTGDPNKITVMKKPFSISAP